MKNMKNRTKFFKPFKGLELEITDQQCCIFVNHILVEHNGRVCKSKFKTFKACFYNEASLKYFLKIQENGGKQEFYGKEKDGYLFILGTVQQWNKKNGLLGIMRQYDLKAQTSCAQFSKNAFTGMSNSRAKSGISRIT